MKRVLLALFVVALSLGCEKTILRQPKAERPTVNVPRADRQENWDSQYGGSCAWASMVSLLRWQGQSRLADWVCNNCAGGAGSQDVARVFDNAGIRVAHCENGDINFIEWACRTRRGCGISVSGRTELHMVALVYLDKQWAAILDNNRVSKFIWIPRDQLIADWKSSYGMAVTPVYSPAAPLPQ